MLVALDFYLFSPCSCHCFSRYRRPIASAFKKTYDYLQKFSALHDPENVHAATVCVSLMAMAYLSCSAFSNVSQSLTLSSMRFLLFSSRRDFFVLLCRSTAGHYKEEFRLDDAEICAIQNTQVC